MQSQDVRQGVSTGDRSTNAIGQGPGETIWNPGYGSGPTCSRRMNQNGAGVENGTEADRGKGRQMNINWLQVNPEWKLKDDF